MEAFFEGFEKRAFIVPAAIGGGIGYLGGGEKGKDGEKKNRGIGAGRGIAAGLGTGVGALGAEHLVAKGQEALARGHVGKSLAHSGAAFGAMIGGGLLGYHLHKKLGPKYEKEKK